MKHITTLALILLALTTKAQVSEIIATGGGQLSASAISIDFTVGDIAVGSFDDSSMALFEGFQAVNYGIGLVTGLPIETAFAFYPNPAQKFLTIDADLAPGSTFRATDVSGRDIELPAELTAHRAVIDISALPNALYVLTIQEANGISYRMKFIKAL